MAARKRDSSEMSLPPGQQSSFAPAQSAAPAGRGRSIIASSAAAISIADAAGYIGQTASSATSGAKTTQRAARGIDKLSSGATRIAPAAMKAASSPAGAALAALASSKFAAIAGKLALPVAAAQAGWAAHKGYQADGIRGAALGAGDSLTLGLASWAAKKTGLVAQDAGIMPKASAPGGTSASNAAPDAPKRISASEARAFDRIEKTRGDGLTQRSWEKAAASDGMSASAEGSGAQSGGSGKRGTQNINNQQAIIAARQKRAAENSGGE